MLTAMKWLNLLVRLPAKPEPIRLEFKCGDWVENAKPPRMSEPERAIALDQATRSLCPLCNRYWSAMIRVGTYPEMQKALRTR